MSRSILDEAHIHPAIRESIANTHADIVREVQAAIATHDVNELRGYPDSR